jgi:subtilisin family serine protease
VAPDGGNTTFFSGDISQDGDAFPNFFGTSASASHAAGAAALLQGWVRGRATPDEVERLLETTAVEMSAPGYDLDTGHGLLDARAAVEALFRFLHDPLQGPP